MVGVEGAGLFTGKPVVVIGKDGLTEGGTNGLVPFV